MKAVRRSRTSFYSMSVLNFLLKNLQGCCLLFNYQGSFSLLSSQRQLIYIITFATACQQLFYFSLSAKNVNIKFDIFHVFIVLPFCTIRSLFYCIFSLLGSAIVRLPLLPASHAPYFRSYASCFTSSSNSSPAE